MRAWIWRSTPTSVRAQRGSLRTTRHRPASSPTTGPRCRITETSLRSTGRRRNPSTSSRAAIRANHSRRPDAGKAKTMNDTSGRTCGKQFATYDPDTRSWRMWPAIGLWGSIEYSETWPKTGYMRNGSAYELPMSEPAIAANGSSSSSLLPTPNAANATQRTRSAEALARNDHQANLTDLPRLLPTPSVADGMGGHLTRSGSRSDELLLPGVAKAAAEGNL